MEMNDKEMLELAAKAVGINLRWNHDRWPMDADEDEGWDPLNDDGDALRLAVELQIEIYTGHDECGNAEQFVGYSSASGRILYVCESYEPDPHAATRRAIVRAAAEIGRSKE